MHAPKSDSETPIFGLFIPVMTLVVAKPLLLLAASNIFFFVSLACLAVGIAAATWLGRYKDATRT